MALPLRRLAGLLIIAASFGCPKAVTPPDAKVANADITVQIGQVVRLDASPSTDPQQRDMSYAWQFTAIPIGSNATLNDAHSVTPSFRADVDGEYDVQVTVSNAFVAAAPVSVKVTVKLCGGRAPVYGSNAVTAKDAVRPSITANFAVGATVVLSSDVSDPDNATTDSVCSASQNQAVSYDWKMVGQPAASAATLNNPTASSPSFVADVAGTYTVRLVATDSTGRASAPFDQNIVVSACGSNAPTITAVSTTTEQLAVGKTIQMSAAPDDADNTTACQNVLGAPQGFIYHWSLPQLPNGSRATLNSDSAANPSFKPDIDGDYSVRLVIEDSTGRTSAAKDTGIHVPRCGNNAPVATITGATGGAAPSAGFIGVLVQFGETVTDTDGPVNGGANPASPACSPTIAQTVTLRWSILALPAGSTAQLNNPTGTNPSFTPDVAGTYTLQLVATDQAGLSSAPVTQTVQVKPCGMTPPTIGTLATTPVADGQGNTTVNAGSPILLTAVAADADNAGTCGLPASQTFSYAWSLVSKPAGSAAFIINPSTDPGVAPATFTPDVPNGTYQVQLVVTDSTGLRSAPAFFSKLFTNSCGSNTPVIDTASSNFASPDPGSTVTLTATGHDPDNSGGGKCSPALASDQTLSYQWTLVSRPSGSGSAVSVSTSPADGSVSTFKPDAIGPYQFSVVVTDATGLKSPPTFVTVQTSLCGSHAPVITAATATPTLASGFTRPRPTLDPVALSGTVTDADDGCFSGNQPKTYSWVVSSRPAGSSAVVANPTSLTAASFTPDVPGDYQFELDATDNLGLKAAPSFASVTADTCSLNAPQVAAFVPQSTTQFASPAFTFPAPGVTNNNCLPSAAASAYAWSIVSAPAGSASTLSNPAVAQPAFSPDKTGDYQFALVVTNGAGISAAPVFLNLHSNNCGNASLGWSSIGVTRVFDPDPAPGGTVFTGGSIPARPQAGAQVTVNAVASDPNAACGAAHTSPISYQWAIVAAPAGSHASLTSATDPSPAFVPDVADGVYQLSVVATDALGNTSAAPNFITVQAAKCGANVPVIGITPADLTAGASIFSRNAQTLSAAAPTNADDSCSTRFHVTAAYSYAWSIASQPSNGNATLSSASGASTSFDAFTPGLYSVRLVATAPTGVSSNPAFVSINALGCGSNAPAVNSISTLTHGTSVVLSRPNVGQQVDLQALTTDADTSCNPAPGVGVVQYDWTAVALPPGSVAPSSFTSSGGTLTNIFTLTPDVAGTYTYSVVATDDTGLTSTPVQVSVSTAACGPVISAIRANASATNPGSATRGDSIFLDVAPSIAHSGTGNGAVSVTGTPSGGAHQIVLKISTGGLAGTALFQTSVDGGAFGAPAATVGTLIVANGTLVTFAGNFVTGDTYAYSTSAAGYLPSDVCVQSPSFAYQWSMQKPPGSQATLSTLTGAVPTFSPDLVGAYEVQLTVTDNAGLTSGTSTLTIQAGNCGGSPIVVSNLDAIPSAPNAGQSVTLGGNLAVDDSANTCGSVGTGTFIYSWSMISSPAGSTAQLSSLSAQVPTFIADVPNGTWQFALDVRDQVGNRAPTQYIGVTSSHCGANAPVFSALSVTTSPQNANSPLSIAATVTDADNTCPAGFAATIPSISWSVVSAPAGSHSSLVSSATVPVNASPNFTDSNTFRADTKGAYIVQAVAHASNGLSTAANLSINVAPTGCGTNTPVITQVVSNDTTAGGATTSRPPVGHVVALVGSQTDPDQTLAVCNPIQTPPSWFWTLVSKPSGSAVTAPVGAQSNTISFTADRAGTFVWSVVATDSFGLTSAPVSITVATGECGPTIPNAAGTNEPIGLKVGVSTIPDNAGGGYSVTQGAALSLYTAALPAPGTAGDLCVVGGNGATEQWTLTSAPPGSNAVLNGSTGATPTFTADLAGVYGIQLVITDNGGFSTVYSTTVSAGACTVSGPQIINSGGQPLTAANMYSVGGTGGAVIFRGDVVRLALPTAGASNGGLQVGTCSPAISYEWSLIGKPAGSLSALSGQADATPSFSADVAGGTYQFALVVRDGLGNASAPFFFSLTASGCGTFPPSFPGGTTLNFSGTPRAGAPITLSTSAAATDGNAGPGSQNGTAGNCPTGRGFQATPITYNFSVVGSATGTSISQTGAPTATLQVASGGNYTVQAVATDSNGRSTAALQSASTAVSNCGAFPPVTNSFTLSQAVPLSATTNATLTESPSTAGHTLQVGGAASTATNYYVGLPISVSANNTDEDNNGGTCALAAQTKTFAWSLISTPGASHLSLGTTNGGGVVFTPDAAGVYALALTTTDNFGYSSTSTLSIGSSVSTGVVCGTNPPAITGGATLTATQAATGLSTNAAVSTKLGVGSAVQLAAATTDADSTVTGTCTVAEFQPRSFAWSFNSLPPGSQATLTGPNTAGASFTPDVSGLYALSLTVTDPQGHPSTAASLTVDASCGVIAPSVRPVGGSGATPEFTITQVLSVNGGSANEIITRSSDPAQNAGTGVSLIARTLYPGVPAALAVPKVLGTSAFHIVQAGCPDVVDSSISYAWSILAQPPGSTAIINNPSAISPSFTPDRPGAYDFRLVLTDQNGRSSTNLLTVDTGGTVHPGLVGTCGTNSPMLVESVPSGGAVGVRAQLDATGSQSPDDYRAVVLAIPQSYPTGCGLALPLSYHWTISGAPTLSTAAIDSPNLINPSFVPDRAGSYTIELTATDGRNSAVSNATFNAGTTAAGFASGTVFTAVTTDSSTGNPVLAWWDNATGEVAASKCTAGCSSGSPTWTSLGVAESGLAPMTFSPNEEPRPIAVAASGGTTWVAFATSTGGGSTGTPVVGTCGIAVATHNGTSWGTPIMITGSFSSCQPDGLGPSGGPYGAPEFGRWLSMTINPASGLPVVTYWAVTAPSGTSVQFTSCNNTNCSAFGGGTIQLGNPAKLGKWVSSVFDASGVQYAAYYVDTDGAGNRGLRFSTNAAGPFTATTIESSATADAGRFSRIRTAPATAANGFAAPTQLIAYADVTNGSANFAKLANCTQVDPSACNGGGWSTATIPDAFSTNYGRAAALAVDTNGLPRVAYYDIANSKVRLLTGNPTAPFNFTRVIDFAANPSPAGLSLAFSNNLLTSFLSFNSATGPQVFAGQ